MDFNDMAAMEFLDSHWAAAFWLTEKDRIKNFANAEKPILNHMTFTVRFLKFFFYLNNYWLQRSPKPQMQDLKLTD